MFIRVATDDIIEQMGIDELRDLYHAISSRIDALLKIELTWIEKEHIREGRKIEAIKLLRGRTDLALTVCKNIVDRAVQVGPHCSSKNA